MQPSRPAPETPADRLRAAATRVRAAWTRGRLVNEHGERCAMGAILNVDVMELLETTPDHHIMSKLAADGTACEATNILHRHLMTTEGPHRWAIPFKPGYTVGDIEGWNDNFTRSGDEVAEVMEKAAAAWEENPDA